MRRRRVKLWIALVSATLIAAAAGWWSWPEDLFFPKLKTAALGPPVSIIVGPNIQISEPQAKLPFTECIIAADPNQSGRLFAASMYWPSGRSVGMDGVSLLGYLSDDGGATWRTSLQLLADQAKKESLADPTATFGPDGDLYFVHMRKKDEPHAPGLKGEDDLSGAGSLDWLCLPSGSTQWETRGRIERHIDRPWLAIDDTKGPYRGRIYCAANVGTAYLITSADGGRTFRYPKVPYPSKWNAIPTQPLVLSDGSILLTFRGSRGGRFTWQPEYMPTFRSTDGGQRLTAGAYVGNWKHPRLTPSISTTMLAAFFPQTAADPRSSDFKDNSYIVWEQGFDNRRRMDWILFSRSADHGKTWSAPVNLSEQTAEQDPSKDYLAYIPCIAVNKAGVVAVTWYDRRGLPQAGADGSARGWNLRMRVSLDGGKTWPPSVQVTSEASRGQLTGWHTAGLCADAAGDFHPAWIDDRTGVPQLWTASVTVEDTGSHAFSRKP